VVVNLVSRSVTSTSIPGTGGFILLAQAALIRDACKIAKRLRSENNDKLRFNPIKLSNQINKNPS
jgi:hypothetical protein